MAKILIIDDDAEFVRLLSGHLIMAGHKVGSALTSVEAVRAAFEFHPDVILLDITMPGMNGWEVCRRLREFFDGVIMMVSALGDEESKVRGLDVGANDYITKPFGHDELLARIRAHLRDAGRGARSALDYRDDRLTIDLQKRIILRDGERVPLTVVEFDLLAYLVRHAGEIIGRDRLLLEALGADYAGEYDYLRVYIHRLRDRLEEDVSHPRYVVTHRGVGYSFGPGISA